MFRAFGGFTLIFGIVYSFLNFFIERIRKPKREGNDAKTLYGSCPQ